MEERELIHIVGYLAYITKSPLCLEQLLSKISKMGRGGWRAGLSEELLRRWGFPSKKLGWGILWLVGLEYLQTKIADLEGCWYKRGAGTNEWAKDCSSPREVAGTVSGSRKSSLSFPTSHLPCQAAQDSTAYWCWRILHLTFSCCLWHFDRGRLGTGLVLRCVLHLSVHHWENCKAYPGPNI